MNQSLTIYTTTLCPVCNMLKMFLDTNEVYYKEVNVDLNPLAMIKLISKTRKFTVPQTNINGKWISGFNPEKIMKEIVVYHED